MTLPVYADPVSGRLFDLLTHTAYQAGGLPAVLLSYEMGDLILRRASRLDAFSAYPIPTWLPSTALGRTAGTPEVSPSRSSRTKESSSQISCAHAG